MQLTTLGRLGLVGSDFQRPKPLLLLAYLGIEGEKDSVHVRQLFWPRAANPSQRLASTVNRLRRGAPGCIERADHKLRTPVPLDATLLLRRLEAGALEEGLELYEGMFLEGLEVKDVGPELEEWVYASREFLAHRVRQALIDLAETRLRADPGRRGGVGSYAERAYLLPGAPEPTPEQFRSLHRLLTLGGSHHAARLRQDAESYGLDLEVPAQEAPTRVGEPGEDERPAPSAAGTGHDLPEPPTRFVGRRTERLELGHLIAQADTRLLTLVGPGGTGKTRLALQLARDLRSEAPAPREVVFLGLEPLHAEDEVVSALALALGLTIQDPRDPLRELRDYLRDKHYLLLLDNFEHLVDAAGFLPDLLGACPDLKVVVASRTRLGLGGELVYPLGGLDLPRPTDSDDEAEQRDAVRLFFERAKTADLGFDGAGALPDVIGICRMVDGLPLGIELAAAWVRLLPVAEIRKEIGAGYDFLASTQRDAAAKHRSLRAVFEHSWRLLRPKEQEVLVRLSVFRGGFTREAAGAVAGADIPSLVALTDASLLRLRNYRFDMHPLVLHYSSDRLAGDEAARREALDRHVACVAALADEQPDDFYTFEQLSLPDRLDDERDNVRAALDRLDETGDLAAGLRLLIALSLFWSVRGHFREGTRQLERFLRRPDVDSADPALLAGALRWHGRLGRQAGAYADARASLERSLALYRRLGDAAGVARATYDLGDLLCFGGELRRAESRLEEARALADDLGLDFLESDVLIALSYLGNDRRSPAERTELATRALALKRRLGDHRGEAVAMNQLALLHYYQRDWESSRRLFEQALEHHRKLGARADIAVISNNLVLLELAQQRVDAAKEHLRTTLELFHELGFLQPLLMSIHPYVRLADGPTAARFLAAILRYVEDSGISVSPRTQEILQAALNEVKDAVGEREYRVVAARTPRMRLDRIVADMVSAL